MANIFNEAGVWYAWDRENAPMGATPFPYYKVHVKSRKVIRDVVYLRGESNFLTLLSHWNRQYETGDWLFAPIAK